MTFDLYQQRDSVLHRLDPRTKILFVLAVFAAAFLIGTPVGGAALLVVLLAGFVAGRLDPRPFSVTFAFVLYLGVVSAVLWSLLGGQGEVLFTVLGLDVRDAALAYGVLVGFRVAAMMLAPLLLLATTRQDDLVQGLHRLGLPHKAAFTIGMAFRMVPTTAGTTMMVRDAQRARGLEFDRGNPVRRMRKNIALLVPLTLLSFDMVERMSLAIASRGLGSGPTRTYLVPLRLRPADVVVLAVLVLALAGLVVARLWT